MQFALVVVCVYVKSILTCCVFPRTLCYGCNKKKIKNTRGFTE